MNMQEKNDASASVSTPDAQTSGSSTAQNNAKLSKAKLFRTAGILYLVLAILALGGTVAWFSTNTNVYIENETPGNVQIQVNSGNLKVSLSEESFADLVTFDTTEKIYYIDVSGDGQQLYYPKSLDANDQPYLEDASTFANVTNDMNFYIQMRLYFQTTTAMNVYLSSSSSVDPVEGFTNQQGANAFSRKSMYGNIGCDAIVGAVRVAFLEPVDDGEGGETLELKCVWIPNDNIALVYEGNTAKIYTDDAHRESAVRGYGYLRKSDTLMEYHAYTSDEYAFGGVAARTEQLASSSTNMINQSIPLLTFDKIGELQTKDLVVRVWFEGTDREADKALNGGEGKYLLNFVGIEKDEAKTRLATETEILNGVVPEGDVGIYFNTARNELCFSGSLGTLNTLGDTRVGDNFILYSTDGLVWKSYTRAGSTIKRKSTDCYVYIRLAETATEKPGDVVKLTVPALEPESD